MELRHLRYFLAVAQTRNFTRAAEQLGVSQPPLSRQIRELEDMLGVDLFLRESRPVQVTEAGRLLQSHAARVLAGVDELQRSLRAFGQARRPRFVIGVVGSILHGRMPEMIRDFRSSSPDTEVELVEMTTLEQVDALKSGRIDAGLGRVRIDDRAIRRTVLHDEPLVAAIPAERAPADEDPPLTVAHLGAWLSGPQALPLIVYPSQPRPSYADQVLALLADANVAPARVLDVREVQTALGLVAAGSGLALVPRSLRHVRHAGLAYVPLEDPQAISPIILSQRQGDTRAVCDEIRAAGQRAFAQGPDQDAAPALPSSR